MWRSIPTSGSQCRPESHPEPTDRGKKGVSTTPGPASDMSSLTPNRSLTRLSRPDLQAKSGSHAFILVPDD